MISSALTSGTDFLARLLAGGGFELVVLVILCVIALIIVIALAWVGWKLLVLLGKGGLWAAGKGWAGARAAIGRKREERLASLAQVASGWDTTRRKSLRRTLTEAERRMGANGVRIVMVSGGETMTSLCSDLAIHAPGPATFAVAAGEGVTLIDASQATHTQMRTLAQALPWTRPFDGVAIAMENEAVDAEALSRAAVMAHACALEVGVHLVVRDPARSGLWTRIEQGRSDGRNACETLAREGARWWLSGGEGAGFERLAGAQGEQLAARLDQAIAAAPTPQVQIASLGLGGTGSSKRWGARHRRRARRAPDSGGHGGSRSPARYCSCSAR